MPRARTFAEFPKGTRITDYISLAHFAVRNLMHEAALKGGEDLDRLSFVHAVRMIRRKWPRYGAIPASGESACP